MKYEVIEGEPPEGYELIEENQSVGDGFGFAVFRNLYENKNGDRISIATTQPFCVEKNRDATDEELIEKYKLK
jgi:hypothetical protein